MSWASTVDERYAGGILSYSAGTYDAPYSTSTAYKLAPRTYAYGALIPVSYNKDKDAYSLGILTPGVYAAFTTGYNWDYTNLIFASAPTAINLHDPTGAIVLTNTLGSLYFTVYQTGTFYISVEGSNYSSSEYSLVYTPNYSGVATIDITGLKSVGSTLSATYTVTDANGALNITPSYQWASSSDGTNWTNISGATSSSYSIKAADANKYLRVSFAYTDNDGFIESFVSQSTTKIAPDTTKPTLSLAYPTNGTYASIASNIIFSFSENIQKGSGSILLKKADGTIVQSFDVGSSTHLQLSGQLLSIDPTADLEYSTAYKVEFGANAITDLSGNVFSQSNSYSFTTVSAPSLASPSQSAFPLTSSTLVNGMTHGFKWNLSENRTVDWSISYGFAGEYWNDPDSVVLYIKAALDLFSYYSNIKFNYLGYFANPEVAATYGSEINVSMDGANKFFSSNSVWAKGFFPDANNNNSQYQGAPGDIYLNLRSDANYLSSYEPGSAGWFLILHELGHTLGLKHPHDDGGTGRPTFSDIGISSLNIDWATVMSYNDTAAFNLLSWDPATPMLLDVLALQYLYGKNETTNSGDTVFELTETNYYATIYDSSGTDEVTAKNATAAWTIYLPNIALTDLVSTKAGFAAPTSQLTGTPHTIDWLAGDIENATGSNFDDYILGNDFSNILNGGSGNDTLNGGASADTLIGGDGIDTAEFPESSINYLIQYRKNSSYAGYTYNYKVTSLTNTNNSDYLVGIESIKFADGTFTLSVIAPPDTTAPTASSFSPADEASAVAIGSNIVVTFTENIQRGAGNIVLKTSDGTTVATYAQASSNVTISGSTLTINPTADLSYSTGYKVEFASGSVQDLAGNDFAGTTAYNFTTGAAPDTTAPTASSFSPADEASAVAIGSNIVVTFTENIQRGAGNIVLKTSDGTTVATYAQASSNVTISGSTLTINPTADLSYSTGYKVEFASGSVQDLAGNDFAGTTAYNFTTGAAPDTTAPTASSFSPADEASAVAIGSNIVVTFSESIQRGAGNIVLKTSDGTTVATYVQASSNVTISGSTLTINPTADLSYSTGYKVEFASGSVQDLAGNDYAGTTSYNFTTGAAPDTTAPTVSSFSPTDEASAIAIASNIVVTFSESIQRGAGNIVLKTSDGTTVATYVQASSNVTISGSTLTINPTADLSYSTGYKVEFASGSVQDLAGNDYAGTTSYNFTTGAAPDTTAPTASSFSPADEASAVAIGSNIVVTFSESIQRGAGNIVLKTSDGTTVATYVQASSNVTISGSTLTINPTADLSYSTGYKVEFASGSVQDLAGNDYAGTTSYNFTTGAAPDTTAPTVSSFSPTDEASAIAIASNIVVTFSESIQRGAGNIVLKTSDGTTVATYVQASSNVTISGSTLTINPTADLSYSTGYKVEFASGSVQDLAGNDYAGTTSYNFTTGAAPDTTAPTASSFSPADEASAVAIGSNIVVTFSESIQRGAGNIVLKTSDGTTVATYVQASSNVTISGSTLTINPTADLSYSTGYKVEFATGSVQDLAGNDYAGTTSYNFTTGAAPDTTAPTASSFSPTDEASAIAIASNIVVTFSESIQRGAGNIVLKTSDGTTVATYVQASSNVTISGSTLTINPTADLSYSTGYKVEFATGSVQDLAGNDYAGTTSYNFTTGAAPDTTADTPIGYNISVKANSWKGSPLAGVKFNETGNSVTDSLGALDLLNVEDKYEVNDGLMILTPNLSPPSSASSASVTLTDVLAALKIYLGKSLPDSYASPFNYIAADFDGNGSVNLTDVLSLLKFYLGKAIAVAPAWVLVDVADVVGSGKTASILRAGSDSLLIDATHTQPHAIDQDFSKDSSIELIGVLRGDVDGSWSG